MSNDNTRVINIKPIKAISQPQVKKNETSINEQEVNRLEEQIKFFQDEIALLEQKREQLKRDTEREISEAKQKWETEKKQLIEQAHEEGYQAGFEQGQEEGFQQYIQLINEVNGLMDQANIVYYETIEQSEEKIIDLAIHSAGKIIDQILDHDRQSFFPIVSSAIKELKDQSNISIYIHPTHFELVLQQKEELNKLVGGDTQLSIYMDQTLKENDCVIEYPFGQIDASVDTQLLQIRKALQEFVQENRQ